MKLCIRLLRAAALSLTLALPVLAAPLRAAPTDTVAPDPALAAFVADLHALAARTVAATSKTAREAGFVALEKMLAPRLIGFHRPLDPLVRWHRLKPDAPGTLADLASYMIEQGDLPEGAAGAPDYRVDMAARLAEMTTAGAGFGRLPDLRGALCTPARLGFDAGRVAAFAKATDSDAYSLRLAAPGSVLRESADSAAPVAVTLDSGTILAFHVVDTPVDGWERLSTSDGRNGWLPERADIGGLSQMHLCFGKLLGTYRLIAFFAFGL